MRRIILAVRRRMDWEGNAGKGDWRNVRKVEWVPDHRTSNVDMDLLEQFRVIRTAPSGACLLRSASLSTHAG